jgi:hypothetical protein
MRWKTWPVVAFVFGLTIIIVTVFYTIIGTNHPSSGNSIRIALLSAIVMPIALLSISAGYGGLREPNAETLKTEAEAKRRAAAALEDAETAEKIKSELEAYVAVRTFRLEIERKRQEVSRTPRRGRPGHARIRSGSRRSASARAPRSGRGTLPPGGDSGGRSKARPVTTCLTSCLPGCCQRERPPTAASHSEAYGSHCSLTVARSARATAARQRRMAVDMGGFEVCLPRSGVGRSVVACEPVSGFGRRFRRAGAPGRDGRLELVAHRGQLHLELRG